MKALLLTASLLILLGCSPDQPDCYIADATKLLDTTKIDGVTYSLVLKVSGFSDKVNFLELYKGVPEYDACGRSTLEPIYSDVVDTLKSNVVRIESDQIRFVEPSPKLPISFENLRFVK